MTTFSRSASSNQGRISGLPWHQEVNSVPILFSKHGADRRQRNFRWRVGGIGREIVSQEKERERKSQLE